MTENLTDKLPGTGMPAAENQSAEPSEMTPAQHKLYSKLQGYYPDKQFGSDTEAMDAAHDRLTDNDTYHDETEKLLQNISDAVDADPEYAQLTAYIGKGMSFREAIARTIDIEDLQAQEGDPDYDALESAKQERMGQRDAHMKRMSEVETNSQESAAKVDQFAQDNNLSEEETLALLQSVEDVVSDIINGKISPDFLAKMLTAENHPKEIAAATENALIEGKNMAIDEKMAKDVSMKGDGMPGISASSGSINTEMKPPAKKNEIDTIVENSARARKF